MRVLRKLHLRENIVLLTIAGVVSALFGAGAGIVFVITLNCHHLAWYFLFGCGTLAGQAVIEGLLGMKVNIWLRRIVTRFINVIPTTIALLLGFDPLSILVYSQVILSLMIPLPTIPVVLLTKNKGVMGEFVNRNITTIISIVFVAIILAFNSYLIATTIKL